MRKRTILIALSLVVAVVGWYLFRPELRFVSRVVNEEFPRTAPQATTILTSGRFHSVAHETKGIATIYQIAEGKHILRFTDFETSNGPDVQIYLVAAEDASDNDTVKKAGFIHLGALKGTAGDQNYDVPMEADLAKYRAVTVWCRRFGVNFGTAPLAPQKD